MKEIRCKKSIVSKIEKDILLIQIEADQEFTVQDFFELKKAALRLGDGEAFYNIIEVGAHTLPNKEAREMSSSIEGSFYKKADAFVITTLAQKIMGSLMVRINRPHVPTRFFRTRDEAQQWIHTLKEQVERQGIVTNESIMSTQ